VPNAREGGLRRGVGDFGDGGVRTAVVGCGYWGSKHVRALQSLDGVASVVAVDRDEARLAGLRGRLTGESHFSSVEEALPHVDAVIVATPPGSHVDIALKALRADKHVLVEKPLATTAEGAARLIRAAEAAGTVLMVGHTFEYNSAVWKMRDLVSSGSLGRLYYVDSARLNLGLYQGDVNVIFDLAPHDISIINYLLGQHPSTVEAWASRYAHTRLEDVAYLRLHYAELGVEANIHVSWLDPHKVRRLTAVGSEKMAVYNDMAAEERIRVHDKGVVFSAADELSQPPMTYRYGDITSPYLDFPEPLSVQDSHFITCIRTGAVPHTDGRNGLAVVRVLEAAQASLRERREIALHEIAGADLGAIELSLVSQGGAS